MNLIEQRPDLFVAWLETALAEYEKAPEHVKADPLGWLLDEAGSLGNYIIAEEGKPDELNTLFTAQHLRSAMMIIRVGAIALSRANPALLKRAPPHPMTEVRK